MLRTRSVLVVVCLAALGIVSPAKAYAAPIVYTFAGTIGMTSGPGPAIGSSIVGTFTYDPAGTFVTGGLNFAEFTPGASQVSATIGGTPYSSPSYQQYLFHNTLTALEDIGIPFAGYDFYRTATLSTPGLRIIFLDADQTVFSTVSSLPAQLPLNQFEHIALTLFLENEGFAAGRVTITSVDGTPVPEPASWLLLGTGAIALVARRVRQRS